jgi:uncharacterized protein (DUF697 family)
MEKREESKTIIKDTISIPYGKSHYYPNISDKVKAKITKNFDANINTNNIVAFVDTTLMGTSKTGLVFTLTGIYNLEMLGKPYYFNYKDIENMTVVADKKGRTHSIESTLVIELTNGSTLTIGYGNFYKDNLKQLFQELRKQFLKWDDVICIKPSGEIGKLHLTEDQKIKCNGIIHTASVAAGGVGTGLAQIPLSDNAVITPIQITMITSLGAVFGIRVTEGVAKGIIGGAAASIIGRGVVQILVGWIPGVGNVINTATAAGITEAIGWMAVAHFFDLQQQDRAKYKIDGMKEGYCAASEEYEGKLRKQADEFLKRIKNCEEQMDEYEKLLSEYEAYIRELERKLDKTEEEFRNLKSMKSQYEALCNLRKCS